MVNLIYGLNTSERGQYAEQEHIGKTTHFIESGYTEWLIPKKEGLNLNYPIITVKELPGMQFYLAHRSKGKPLFGRCRI